MNYRGKRLDPVWEGVSETRKEFAGSLDPVNLRRANLKTVLVRSQDFELTHEKPTRNGIRCL
ncbi:MAG: hypothetical protein V7638_2759, partial [Acidobacteriota bacterium]